MKNENMKIKLSTLQNQLTDILMLAENGDYSKEVLAEVIAVRSVDALKKLNEIQKMVD